MNMKQFFGRLKHGPAPEAFNQQYAKNNNDLAGTGNTRTKTTPDNNVFPSDRNILYSGLPKKGVA